MQWQEKLVTYLINSFHKLKEVGDICRVLRAILFVQLNDDTQTHQHILFVVDLVTD